MQILPLLPEHFPQAARLFTAGYVRQRAAVPDLPADMADPSTLEGMLAGMSRYFLPGLGAFEDGALIGYLNAFIVDHFRDTPRQGAYVPEWAHAAREQGKAQIYRALYQQAARQWFNSGCRVHAITLLACDSAAHEAWFQQGFGMVTMDALRPITPLDPPPQPAPGLTVRRAELADAPLLAELEAEHWQHYRQPPILMTAGKADDAGAFGALIADPQSSAWIAEYDGSPAGYLRFEQHQRGACTLVASKEIIACDGAFMRPAYRGRGAAPALLDAALRHYAARGIRACSVDFESFNPEAIAFWPRYFQPVCISLMRIPELE